MIKPIKLHVFSIFFFLLVNTSFSFGQTKTFYEHGYKIEQYGNNYGFKYDEVTDIIQDNRGYIWMANQIHLVRYDGYEFKFYRPNKKDRNYNSEDYLYHLMEDNDGNILGSTFGKTIWKFNPLLEFFEPIDSKGSGKGHGPIRPLVQDTVNKNIWVGLSDGLVELEDKDTLSIKWHLPINYGFEVKNFYDSLKLSQQILAALLKVKNNQQVEKNFSVEQSARVAIIAQGEILNKELLKLGDYGWIENQLRDTIWKMDKRKSQTTGELNSNRLQLDIIELEPGDYQLKYKK